MTPEPQIRWHGKFSSKKKIKRFQQYSQMGKKNKKVHTKKETIAEKTAKNGDNTFPIEGNRIVNWKHMAGKMFCSGCESPLLIQNIRSETKKGLASILHVFCKECLLLNKVTTGEQHRSPVTGYPLFDVNTKAAIAALHAGCGATKANKLLQTICAEAALLERIATLENIEELKKMIPEHLKEGFLIVNIEPTEDDAEKMIVRIFVSYDMAWSQRSNGYKYDSLNGFCAIIGLNTGKVVDYCTRNRKCSKCDMQINSGKVIPHDCRLNFRGSAKAMEADGAVELCTKSNILKDANVEVGVFIGDNDSSSLAAIQEASDHEIIKQCDMNHSKKGVGKVLYQIKNNKVY